MNRTNNEVEPPPRYEEGRLGEAEAGEEKKITGGIGVLRTAFWFLSEEGIASENALDGENEVTSGLRFQDVALSADGANITQRADENGAW